MSFVGRGDSKHMVPMDASETYGGADGGARPTELLLMSLGGCTGMDVVSILQKKKAKIDDFWLELSADKTDVHPKMLKDIKVKFVIVGRNIQKKEVKRAIELSTEKYCTVGAMLKASATIEYDFEIRETGAGEQ
ncbi:MAG: OsmC family protein [Methanobacteriota archaeon]